MTFIIYWQLSYFLNFILHLKNLYNQYVMRNKNFCFWIIYFYSFVKLFYPMMIWEWNLMLIPSIPLNSIRNKMKPSKENYKSLEQLFPFIAVLVKLCCWWSLTNKVYCLYLIFIDVIYILNNNIKITTNIRKLHYVSNMRF